MSPFYRDRQAINSGGGTGTRVTNACFEHTAKHSEEFHFVHCNYSNFKGTELSWGGISVIVSDEYLDSKELNEYTDEQCVELVLRHISAKAMLDKIAEIVKDERRNAVNQFRKDLREMIGV